MQMHATTKIQRGYMLSLTATVSGLMGDLDLSLLFHSRRDPTILSQQHRSPPGRRRDIETEKLNVSLIHLLDWVVSTETHHPMCVSE